MFFFVTDRNVTTWVASHSVREARLKTYEKCSGSWNKLVNMEVLKDFLYIAISECNFELIHYSWENEIECILGFLCLFHWIEKIVDDFFLQNSGKCVYVLVLGKVRYFMVNNFRFGSDFIYEFLKWKCRKVSHAWRRHLQEYVNSVYWLKIKWYRLANRIFKTIMEV